MRSEIERTLNLYFSKKFKGKLEDDVPVTDMYEIIAKPIGIDLNSPEIQRLLMRVTAIHMTGRSSKYVNLTQLFNPIFELCLYCREDKYVSILNNLWAKGTVGISIPDLERKVSRGGKPLRINSKTINFDTINYSFKQIEQKLDLIFFAVCTKNNIKIPFDMSNVLNQIGDLDQ